MVMPGEGRLCRLSQDDFIQKPFGTVHSNGLLEGRAREGAVMRLRTILVGVQDYDKAAGLTPLQFAVEDARRMRAFFAKVRPDIEHKVELDAPFGILENPEKSRVEQVIDEARNDLEAGDLLLLYFSGHGVRHKLSNQVLFLCKDANRNALLEHASERKPEKKDDHYWQFPGAIGTAALFDSVGQGPFDCAIVCDMCRADLTEQHKDADLFSAPFPETSLETDPSAIRAQFRDIPSLTGSHVSGTFVRLFSCRDYERSLELPRLKGGLYTMALCAAMDELWREDSAVYFNERLAKRTDRLMRELAARHFFQTPERQVTPDKAELLLCRRRKDVPPFPIDKEPPGDFPRPDVEIKINDLSFPPPELHLIVPSFPPDLPQDLREFAVRQVILKQTINSLSDETHPRLRPSIETIRDAERWLRDATDIMVANRPAPEDLASEECGRLEDGLPLDRIHDADDLQFELLDPPKSADVTRYLSRVAITYEARRRSNLLRERFREEVEKNIVRLKGQLLEVEKRLQDAYERDFNNVILRFLEQMWELDTFPHEHWSDYYPHIKMREYPWPFRVALEKAQRIFYTRKYHDAGTSGRKTRSREFLERCAKVGVLQAQKDLASRYTQEQQHEIAFRWWNAAANQEDPEAMYTVAKWYDQGLGTPQDGRTAADWYERAALRNHVEAQFRMANLLKWGTSFMEGDLSKRREWLERAAEQNHPGALRELIAELRISNNRHEIRILRKKLRQIELQSRAPSIASLLERLSF